MTALHDQLSWLIGLYPRRGDLAASTWLRYRTRARQDLLRLAQRPWTDPDCLRMAKRILREVDLWVAFLWDATGEMEPTNNRSERALRPVVIDRKRMQQSRSLIGMFRDEVLRSVAATCQQLGVDFGTVVAEALLARSRAGPSPTPPETLTRAFHAACTRAAAARPSANAATVT